MKRVYKNKEEPELLRQYRLHNLTSVSVSLLTL
jgi:hypothetical protein